MIKILSSISCCLITSTLVSTPSYCSEKQSISPNNALLSDLKNNRIFRQKVTHEDIISPKKLSPEESTIAELPKRPSPLTASEKQEFYNVGYRDLSSSEAMRILLVSGYHTTKHFNKPLIIKTADGREVNTGIIEITVGENPISENKISSDGKMSQEGETKFFKNHTELKVWLDQISSQSA